MIHMASLAVLALSALGVLVRCWRGPTVFDRVLAIDTLTLVVVATLLAHHDLHIDAAFGLALFAFVTTVLFGYFLGKGEFPHE
jgi:multisubunit Na+/H+ antiporter MnhF subunit